MVALVKKYHDTTLVLHTMVVP